MTKSHEVALPDRVGRWLSKQKTRLAIAATIASLAATAFTSPFGETRHRLASAAKWVIPSALIADALWLGGAAMMLASIGGKIGNPLTIKKRVPAIASQANTSTLFETGFWVNTTAAVAEFGIITAGVTTELPLRSWGLAAFGLVDLSVTIAVRRAIRSGIRKNASRPPLDM